MHRIVMLAGLLAGPACPALAWAAEEPGFEVTGYALALRPDVAAKTLSGRETITIRVTRAGLGQLRFSGNALTIDSATIGGVAMPHAVQGDLTFDLPKPLPRGRTVRLEIAYHGAPARGFSGTGGTLYTSYFACQWMICRQDDFGDKASFALDLTVPAGLQAFATGALRGTRAGPDGGTIQSWRSPRPYSAYLYGFAIGRFTQASDTVRPARLSYVSDMADEADLRQSFADTAAMVRFLSDKAGLPLPVAEYRQLLVKGGDAQEAATYSVLGDQAVPEKPGDPTADWAIVHELAHQWWGNLITCTSLQHFWLNEGFATFMTAAWKEQRYGRAAYDAELDGARRRLERARGLGFDKPLAWDGQYPSLPARRAVQYGKGALFLDHLRTLLGDKAFWSGIRHYTRTHAGGTVTSLDFERAMEAASRRDLTPVFAEWVFGNGKD